MEQRSKAIGRYIVKDALGRGRWGVVYRAYDPELNRSVALKYIPLADETQRRRCRRKARVAANLRHPHIVPIYDATQTDDAVYIVMELLPGGTLRQSLDIPLAWHRGVSLLLPLCDALAYAHQQGVIHRGVKPENILFSGSGVIRLADFGLAYVVGACRLTRGSGMVGTPCYAAPEQIRGESVDGRADVFALATVLYETLTGQPIFGSDDDQVIYQITRNEPVDLSPLQGIVPPFFLESLARALAKDPADRYTAGEFGAALCRCLDQCAAGTDETPTSPGISSPLTIRLEWPTGVPHISGEHGLLRHLYRDESSRQPAPGVADRSIGRIIVKEELPGGFGGTRILVVIPVERNGVYQAARVVKLGPRVMLEAERDNYDNFVREHLPTAVASRKRFAAQGTMAAIEYVFVGGGLLELVHDLITCYQGHSAREIAKTLHALLSDHLGQHWFRQGRLLEEHTAVEYGPHHELLKAFRVIWAIRRLANRFHPRETPAETYFRCLLLYNLAVLKYAREAALAQDGDAEEQDRQLQAARLCFIAAAVQGCWLESPPQPMLRLRGMLEQWRESLIGWLVWLARPALYLSIAVFLVIMLGLGYSAHRSWRQARRAQAKSLNSQCAIYLQQSDRAIPGGNNPGPILRQPSLRTGPRLRRSRPDRGGAERTAVRRRAGSRYERGLQRDRLHAEPSGAMC